MSKPKIEEQDTVRYFILQRDSLSMYGNEAGSNKAEAERLLGETSDISDLVVIRGVAIKPRFKLELYILRLRCSLSKQSHCSQLQRRTKGRVWSRL